MRRFALWPLVFLLFACAAPAPRPVEVQRPADSAGLELVSNAFSIIERQYAVVPNFADARHGALGELEKTLPEGSFRVEGGRDGTTVSYRVPGDPVATARFSGVSREEALRDLASAHRIARRVSPDLGARELEYALLRGALKGLDPQSSFLDPEGYRETRVETAGDFGGAGLELAIRDDQLTVVAPIEGAPAERAGIQAGDRLVKIDGRSTKGMTLVDAVKRLRGPRGTTATLTIQRDGAAELQDMAITREVVRVQAVRVEEIEPRLGYVRIRQFQERTAPELEAGLEKLEETGRVAGLVLDLRNNPGGLLSSAIGVAEKFLEGGKLVVYTQGRVRKQNMRFVARAAKPITRLRLPLVVLVNQGSAAASEIVASALQDHGRAIVLGMRTSGSSSIQTIIPLPDGSALRLTTAHYFPPKGALIHGRGIMPDIVVESPKDDAKTPTAALSESEQWKRDVQLQRALERLRVLAR